MFGSNEKPTVTIWEEVPSFPTWAYPSVYYNGSDVLVCFETRDEGKYSIVFFEGVIEYLIQLFTDESLGGHECSKYGLNSYEFNIVNSSPKLEKWRVLKPKHWVITFKDETLDVISKECRILEAILEASDKLAAIKLATESHGITGNDTYKE
ncbi:MAG: hypothetical protein ABW092_09195 [Candidatus Thiodiazotropha sp.]